MTEPELGSLSHRIAERRRERERRRKEPIIIPVPGYSDLFAVRYRRLTGGEADEIIKKHDPEVDGLAGPISMLITACEEILEVTGRDEAGKPTYEPLGRKWTPTAIRELFEADFQEGITTRLAMEQVLHENEISRHFKAYTDAVREQDKDDAEALPGESKPSGEGSSI